MLHPDVRRVLDGTSFAHLATVLPDGAPHSVPLFVGTHGDHVAIWNGDGEIVHASSEHGTVVREPHPEALAARVRTVRRVYESED